MSQNRYFFKVPRRQFLMFVSSNRVVYAGVYPLLAFINWGQQNIQPFEVGGTDSTKPFSDLP
jgi:hypothetical protein